MTSRIAAITDPRGPRPAAPPVLSHSRLG